MNLPDRPIYALRCTGPRTYEMAKFSMPDFNVEATYTLEPKGAGFACNCPASARIVKLKPCKHQRMLPYMLGAANSNRFFEPETRSWIEMLPPHLAENADLPVVGEALGSPSPPPPEPEPPALPPVPQVQSEPAAPHPSQAPATSFKRRV